MNFIFKKIFISLFLVFLSDFIFGQIKVDSSFNIPVKENIHYRVYYKLGGVWVYAAVVNFKTDTVSYDGKLAYKLIAEGYTRKKYDWIYSLEDHYTSIVDYHTFFPFKFEEHNIEKGVTYDYKYIFDRSRDSVDIFMKTSNNNIDTSFSEPLPDFITDPYSAVQYIRTLDYSNIKPGKIIKFNTILDGKIYTQKLIYQGKDVVKDSEGNDVSAFKLEAPVKNSSFFSSKNGINIWITDNKDRWIIKVYAKIVVGSIIVFMDEPGLASFVNK